MSIPNVGRLGSQASNSEIGKLLVTPPSVNQLRRARVGAGPGCSGTDENSSGTLRLMRTAMTTGRSSRGRRRRPCGPGSASSSFASTCGGNRRPSSPRSNQ